MNRAMYFTDHIVALAKHAIQHRKDRMIPFLQANPTSWSPRAMANEFHTLKLRFHRRAGHTQAAVELLKEFPDAFLVVPGDDAWMLEHTQTRLKQHGVDPQRCALLGEPMSPEFSNPACVNCPLIIVDMASALDPEAFDGLFDRIHPLSPDAFYLLLG